METRRKDIDVILCEAVEIESAADRAAFLDEACAGDHELRHRLNKLVADHFRAGDFLEEPAVAVADTIDRPIAEGPGTIIGRYKLLEQIGEGGFGVVYMAEQQEPVRRKVALKIIKPGMDTKEVIARFEAERQALAMMDHPNIAKVLDAGSTGQKDEGGRMKDEKREAGHLDSSFILHPSSFSDAGRPYFVMELVHGIPLTEYCDQNELTTDQRLELFVSVCQAVQHAHQKGIIHRDIKPSNVMVTLHDGVPVPKIIDFGIAKATNRQLTEKTVFTGYGQMIGSPLYMSPEQAEMSGLDVDTRSDIYSLGVLLYELLTGSTPFDKKRLREVAYDEMCRMIREEEPPRPSARISTMGEPASTISAQRKTQPAKLRHLLRGELDWIVMKALEKDRTRRYETASAFADDVQRYLADEAVEACPPSTAYRLRKFARRNKTALVVVAVVTLALVVGAGVAAWQSVRATLALGREREARGIIQEQHEEVKRQRDEVAKREAMLRRHLYAADVNRAWQAWKNGDGEEARRLLSRHQPISGQEDLRSFGWYYLWQLCQSSSNVLRGHADVVYSVAYSPDGEILASGGGDRTIVFWDPATGKKLDTLSGHTDDVNFIAFSSNGRTLATAGEEGVVRLWDTASRQPLKPLTGFEQPVAQLLFTPDGETLVVAEIDWETYKSKTTLWDLSSGELQGTIEGQRALALSPDGLRLATGSADGTVRLVELATRRQLATAKGHSGALVTGAFSGDGQKLATGGRDLVINVWSGTDLQELIPLQGHYTTVRSLAFSPNGNQLVGGVDEGVALLWDPDTGITEKVLGHTDRIWSVAFSPDGSTLATACGDGTVTLWGMNRPSARVRLPDHPRGVDSIAFLSGGGTLATACGDSKVRRWNTDTGELEGALEMPGESVLCLAVSRQQRHMALVTGKEVLLLVDPVTGIEQHTLSDSGLRPTAAAFSPDHRSVVVSAVLGSPSDRWCITKLWNLATGEELLNDGRRGWGQFTPSEIAFSPDGKTLALQRQRDIELLDLATQKVRNLSTGQAVQLHCVAYSPDGGTLATGAGDRSIKLFDMPAGRERATMLGHTSRVTALVFSPRGDALASGDGAGEVKLWDVFDAQHLLTLKGHTGRVRCAAFSPDGTQLATAGVGVDATGEVNLWCAPRTQAIDPDHTGEDSRPQGGNAGRGRDVAQSEQEE